MFDGRLSAIGFLTAAMILIAAGVLQGQEIAAETDPVVVALHGRVSRFFEDVSMGKSQEAYSALLSGSPLFKQADAVKELVQRTDELKTKYGRFRAFERVSVKRVGKDLTLMKYLYKCEAFPVVWYFTFYRTSAPGESGTETATWRVVIVRFDTQLELLGL